MKQWISYWYYWKNTEFAEFKRILNWKCSLNKSYQVLFSQKHLWLLLHTDYLHDLRKSLEIIYYLGYRAVFEFPATCAKIRQIQSKIVTEIFFFNWIEEAFVACYKPTGIWLAFLIIYHVLIYFFLDFLCQPYNLMLKSSFLKCGISFLTLSLFLSVSSLNCNVIQLKPFKYHFAPFVVCIQALELALPPGSVWGWAPEGNQLLLLQ